MDSPDRRVHKLRIQSRDESCVSSDVHALQDAFNVASLPGLPRQGLLLIKQFDLGTYPSNSTSLDISRIIDERVQSLEHQSFCVDDGDHPQQNLVWFSDRAQAVFCLVKSIRQSGGAQAWYWRTLFPSWRPDMSLAETLIATSRDFPGQESKPFVFAQVIEQLLSQSNADTILAAVTPDLAHQQLGASGLYPGLVATNNSSPPGNSRSVAIIPTHWEILLQRAIIAWGEQDVRSVWIAFSALIMQNPAIIESTVLMPMITSLIKIHSAGTENAEKHKEEIEFENIPDKVGIISPRPDTSAVSTKPGFDSRSPNQSRPQQVIQFFDAEPSRTVENRPVKTPVEKNTNRPVGQNIPLEFEYSENCGLAFIIPLLECLAIKELLSLNPEMAAINLPVRVVQATAQRLVIAGTHPVLLAMPEEIEPASKYIENFVCPSDWQVLINTTKQQKKLNRYKVTNSICYITDRTNKLLLYVGDNELPGWMASHQILDQAGNHDYPGQEYLQTTIQLLASRYLYRYAKISLRNLINRGGRIANSNTHLDVLFDGSQIDIRIRMAGLDIDPGWVPWCARVVQFHYSDGGSGDA